MYSLFKNLKEEKLSLAYFGVFSDTITDLMISLSENNFSKQDHLKKLSRRTSFLIAESFQNIIRHGHTNKNDVSEIEYGKDFFYVSILDDKVVIASANIIKDEDAENLDSYIDKINSLSEEELKELYRNTLNNSNFSAKGGAGLGIIDMVRKAGFPLKKKFVYLKEGYKLVILGLELMFDKNSNTETKEINKIEDVFKNFAEKNIVMLYKGDFSASSNTNIIEIFKNNIGNKSNLESEKIKNIIALIEVTQNVSKHSKETDGAKEGIFMITNINGELYYECGNYVRNEDYNEFREYLKEIKNSNMSEINTLYKNKMLVDDGKIGNTASLGLLEVAKLTKNTFSYSFVETSQNEIFYIIRIKTV